MSVSLTAAVKVCRFNTADAIRLESDRFLNSENVVCPLWGGTDAYGRVVCADSYNTKTAGCKYAEDRIVVENDLRPQYSAFITLNPEEGIHGDIYGGESMYGDRMSYQDSVAARKTVDDVYNRVGSAGIQMQSAVYPNCPVNPYSQAMALDAQAARGAQAAANGYRSCGSRTESGM